VGSIMTEPTPVVRDVSGRGAIRYMGMRTPVAGSESARACPVGTFEGPLIVSLPRIIVNLVGRLNAPAMPNVKACWRECGSAPKWVEVRSSTYCNYEAPVVWLLDSFRHLVARMLCRPSDKGLLSQTMLYMFACFNRDSCYPVTQSVCAREFHFIV
jgi:hypothetical protein